MRDAAEQHRGNPLRNVSQGGGVQSSFSGGDERSEPENAELFAHTHSSKGQSEHNRRAVAERRGATPGTALPCLSSNNCTESKSDKLNILTGAHKRTAFVVAFEIEWLIREFGIEHIGFFTLTFKDNVTDIREAQRRFRSLRAHVIAKRYERAIGVWERHKSGRIHFHLVLVLKEDIRTGADFEAFKQRNYRSANTALRAEWAFWRKTCPKYGFGRHELMPVKSNGQGIARYVGKYISKHIGQRLAQDKGARVVRFIGYKPGMRKASSRFSWNTINGWLWRRKVSAYLKRVGVADLGQLKIFYGHRWAYYLRDAILGETLESEVFPSRAAAERARAQGDPMLLAKFKAREIMQNRRVTRAVLLRARKFDGDPVWNVPRWVGEWVSVKPLSAEVMAEAEERAREMRLYALRLPPVRCWKWNEED